MKKLMILLALACPAVSAAQTTPNDRRVIEFEAYWRPLIPLYGHARVIEDCGVRGPDWFSAVSTGLTDSISDMDKKIWLDDGDAFVDEMNAFTPVGNQIQQQVALADAIPVTECNGAVSSAILKKLDGIAASNGYGG